MRVMIPTFITTLIVGLSVTIASWGEHAKSSDDKRQLDPWKKGYLDIHHISTGRGNCTFMILPDGTTFMIDVGDLGDSDRFSQIIMKARPNGSCTPAEWIARYVRHFSEPAGRDMIDYLLITHFDGDHIGTIDKTAKKQCDKSYLLTGVTHLANLIDIRKIIDRGYPTYDYPTLARTYANKSFPNYLKYIVEREQEGKCTEMFEVGSNSQIHPLYDQEHRYDVEIRNIAANDKIWNGSQVENHVPNIGLIPAAMYPSENNCSCVITLRYGDFKYYTGGDILGESGNSPWYDVETPVGRVVGPTDVVVANHHAYKDGMNRNFISSVQPRIFIIPVWDYFHPHTETLRRLTDPDIYAESREIYPVGIVSENLTQLGTAARRLQPSGHVVVRVYNGGKRYRVYVLDDSTEKYTVIYRSKLYRPKVAN